MVVKAAGGRGVLEQPGAFMVDDDDDENEEDEEEDPTPSAREA
jgi:hypothetical protein